MELRSPTIFLNNTFNEDSERISRTIEYSSPLSLSLDRHKYTSRHSGGILYAGPYTAIHD